MALPSARRRWLATILALVVAGALVQAAITTAMLWSGTELSGRQWLHNDSVTSIERINSDIVDELVRAAADDAADLAAGRALDDRRRGRSDDIVIVVAGDRVITDASPCTAAELARASATVAHPAGRVVVCRSRAYLATSRRVGEARADEGEGGITVWELRALNDHYVDRAAEVTLCEVEIVVDGVVTTSLRSVEGARLPVAVPQPDTESASTVDAVLPAPYRGIGIGSFAIEDWPERGASRLRFIVNARPIGDGVTLVTMVPADLMTRNLWLAVVALVAVALVMTALLGCVADRLIARYVQPLRDLERAAQTIADGDLASRVKVHGDREVSSVAESFNTMAEKLAASRSQLVQQEKMVAVGQLAAGVAHEMNTPLQFATDNVTFLAKATRSMADAIAALRGELGGDDDERVRRIDAAHRLARTAIEAPKAIEGTQEGLRRVSSIVGAMRTFSRPSNAMKEPVSLRVLLDATAAITRNEWKYVADLDVNVSPDLPNVPALGDELSQVFLNLIVNAAHAIESRYQGARRGRIVVDATVDGGRARVRIKDDGVGVPLALQSRIFEPFFTTKPFGKGTGQGLAIAYDIVVGKHGGVLTVESAPDEGATFVIEIPLAPPPTTTTPAA